MLLADMQCVIAEAKCTGLQVQLLRVRAHSQTDQGLVSSPSEAELSYPLMLDSAPEHQQLQAACQYLATTRKCIVHVPPCVSITRQALSSSRWKLHVFSWLRMDPKSIAYHRGLF